MSGYYFYMPSPTDRGGLTATEIMYAQMPCYFGLQDTITGKFSSASVCLQVLLTEINLDPCNLPESCILCWDDLGAKSSYRRLPCSHVFHLPCIDSWLRGQDASCPLCRRTFYHLRQPRVVLYTPTMSHGTDSLSPVMLHVRNVRSWIAKKLIAK